jgi:hypothetical protein
MQRSAVEDNAELMRGRYLAVMQCSAMEDNAESVRWFASLTMTWVFMGGTWRTRRCFVVRRAAVKINVMLTSGRHLAGWHGGCTVLSARWFASLTMTWFSWVGQGVRGGVLRHAVSHRKFIVMLTGGRHLTAGPRRRSAPQRRSMSC